MSQNKESAFCDRCILADRLILKGEVNMNRRKWLGIVLAMVLNLSSLFKGFGTPANAQGTGKEVDATITDFHIESPKGTTVTEINTNDSFHLAMD